MADKSCRETRRQSFRRTIADAALPPEYLESLELKRRQLDDSIHKYIAAKEREFKQYEKDLRHQTRAAVLQDLREHHHHDHGDHSPIATRPRAASDLPHQSQVSALTILDPLITDAGKGKGKAKVNGEIHGNGDGIDESSLRDTTSAMQQPPSPTARRVSVEREKDFIGVFTPHYLPALGVVQAGPSLDRTSSEPLTLPKVERLSDAGMKRVQRANSDTAVQADPRRPPHLSIASRTSSSGSSVDGGSKLTSVLKSPTHSTRPTRKRVSLAVGDAIVAPSDSVPDSLSQNSTSSHSRTRARSLDTSAIVDGEADADSPVAIPDTSETLGSKPHPSALATSLASATAGTQDTSPTSTIDFAKVPVAGSSPLISGQSKITESRASKIDPDGDFFDLDQEEVENDDRPFIDDLEDGDGVSGRVELSPPPDTNKKADEYYEPSEGMMPVPRAVKEDADPVEFRPGSVSAAQQPTAAGFRRPSVISDPIYQGADYDKAEHAAVTDEIYGSSYSRPSSRGSFTAGSLGESFMTRHVRRQLAAQDYPRSPR